MTEVPRSRVARYALAVATSVTSTLAALLLYDLFEPTPFLPFFAAVAISAWYGGLGPGLLATALGALAGAYLFFPPTFSLQVVSPLTLVRAGGFVLVASLITVLSARLRAAQARALALALAHEQAEQALLESKQLYGLLVENVRDYAIFMLDPDGRVRTWGAGAAAIFGYSDAEIVSQSGARLFTSEDIQRGVPEQELSIAATKCRAMDERWHVRKDGSRFWARVCMQRISKGLPSAFWTREFGAVW